MYCQQFILGASVRGQFGDIPIPDWLTTPRRQLGPNYTSMLRSLRELPFCVGWHVRGAYMKNRSRNGGFLDEDEKTEPEFTQAVTEANRETAEWVKRQVSGA